MFHLLKLEKASQYVFHSPQQVMILNSIFLPVTVHYCVPQITPAVVRKAKWCHWQLFDRFLFILALLKEAFKRIVSAQTVEIKGRELNSHKVQLKLLLKVSEKMLSWLASISSFILYVQQFSVKPHEVVPWDAQKYVHMQSLCVQPNLSSIITPHACILTWESLDSISAITKMYTNTRMLMSKPKHMLLWSLMLLVFWRCPGKCSSEVLYQ